VGSWAAFGSTAEAKATGIVRPTSYLSGCICYVLLLYYYCIIVVFNLFYIIYYLFYVFRIFLHIALGGATHLPPAGMWFESYHGFLGRGEEGMVWPSMGDEAGVR